MTLESKNRWTASSATILDVASRNSGVFVAGGSGMLRLLHGIQTGVRDIQLDTMITKIEIDDSCQRDYRHAAEYVYLGCGTDGVACVKFGHPTGSEERSTEGRSYHPTSLLSGEYSDMHYFRDIFR
jgi:hypothetical protein